MRVISMINLIKLETNDLLDSDQEYVYYINRATEYIGLVLGQLGLYEFMVTTAIQDGQDVPPEFVNFVPKDGYPVYIENQRFYTYDGEPKTIKFNKAVTRVTTFEEDVPLPTKYLTAAVFVASYLVKKKMYIPIEYTETDKGFMNEVIAAIQRANGAV